MPLTMARPYKDPKTGIYRLRRVVPESLRQFVGKREEKLSLGTRDPEEARRLHAKAMAEIEARWANLRAGERTLTEREAHEMAKPLKAKFLALYLDDPSQQPWYPECYDQLSLAQPYDSADDELVEGENGELIHGRRLDAIQVEAMRRFALAQANYVLDAHGLRVDILSHLKQAKACAIALQAASIILARSAETGEPIEVSECSDSPSRIETRSLTVATLNPSSSVPPSSPQRSRDRETPALTLTGILAGWWAEAKISGLKQNTYESYSSTLNALITFLGHDDAFRVQAKDIVAFKDCRLTIPSTRTGKVRMARTVKDGDLGALRTVFGWAVDNLKLSVNPVTGIKIKLPKSQRLRQKWFTDDEAKAILIATLHLAPSRVALKTQAAKRWVPWLCAFTGSRVGEMAQLRKEDIIHHGKFWILRITPEAGTVKTNQTREIVLHPQVIEQGFLLFVESAPAGHLFLTPREDGDILKPLDSLNARLAEFGRKMVPDKGVDPNHGWRHRFKTVGLEIGIQQRVLDAIQGHSSRSASDDYGDVTLKTQADAISKLPYYDLS
ncbi:DUF6538 domain-containing protein [Methylobacterium sp. E-046]|uniref:DUF6538 domain-containing protein n=1 Tax=Methylobacterium sp. E-046 TaxID=2836576 RepID=UPI001FBB7178|nr:DUF6538 domain-containing protein [Methylobacterium sp. E-046]MCJ2100014.1 hypothetical protein [Methylobacterium sp. E-046]